jgi:Domain of unknown function (DUF4386)
LVVPPKIGSAAAIAGSAFLVGGTMFHPMTADPADPVAAFAEYAADRLWIASHLSQFVGVALMVVGLVTFAGTLRDRKNSWMARLGLYFAVAALAAAAVLQAVDGIALKAMVDIWAGASPEQKQASYFAALAVRQVEIGAAAYAAILFGASIFLIACADIGGNRFERWFGWLGIAGGIGTIAAGVLMAFTGFSSAAQSVSMLFSLTIVVWMVGMGALVWRR